MTELVISHFSGLSPLVDVANIVFLLAFSVRDVLKLRILSVVATVIILPYYYLQPQPLWPPIFWGVALTIINAVQMVFLYLERRPVVLGDREASLHRLAFGSIDRRDFVRLMGFARWTDCEAGDTILAAGSQNYDAIVLVSGPVEAVLDGRSMMAFRPGQLIGNAYSGLAIPTDVVARGPATLVRWDREQLQEFADRRPDLRAQLLEIRGVDLAAKLRDSVRLQF